MYHWTVVTRLNSNDQMPYENVGVGVKVLTLSSTTAVGTLRQKHHDRRYHSSPNKGTLSMNETGDQGQNTNSASRAETCPSPGQALASGSCFRRVQGVHLNTEYSTSSAPFRNPQCKHWSTPSLVRSSRDCQARRKPRFPSPCNTSVAVRRVAATAATIAAMIKHTRSFPKIWTRRHPDVAAVGLAATLLRLCGRHKSLLQRPSPPFNAHRLPSLPPPAPLSLCLSGAGCGPEASGLRSTSHLPTNRPRGADN